MGLLDGNSNIEVERYAHGKEQVIPHVDAVGVMIPVLEITDIGTALQEWRKEILQGKLINQVIDNRFYRKGFFFGAKKIG